MHARPLLAALAFSAATLASCGGKPPPAPVVANVVAPPPTTTAPPENPPPAIVQTRPSTVAAWLHVDNVPAWVAFFGIKPDDGDADDQKVAAMMAAIDFARPFDAAITYAGGEDGEAAAIIPIRDKQKFLDLAKDDADITERKSRYVITPKKKDGDDKDKANEKKDKKKGLDDKVFACELMESPRVAICGTEGGLSDLAPWLRSSPKPQTGDIALEIYAGPLRQTMLDALKDKPDSSSDTDTSTSDDTSKKITEQATAFVKELDKMTFAGTITDKTLDFSMSFAFNGVESPWVKPMFLSPSGIDKPDLLFKLTENASAALYSQGGGPLPMLLDSFDAWSDLSGPEHDKGVALTAQVRALFTKPFGVAYGIDIARVTKSVADLRNAKDADKAKKALAQAIDGYSVVGLSTDAASLEKMVREFMRLSDVEHKATKSTSDSRSKTSVRAAPAALGLPKGSFFLDDTSMVAGKTPKAPKTKQVKTSALVVSDGAFAYVVLGLADDRAYSDVAKEIVARKSSARALDPLLQRPGLLLGGQVTSMVGAFGSHEVLLKEPGKMDQASRTALADDLTKDLAAPRLPVPFALTATKNGNGGVLAFEVKGEKQAFNTIFEHAFEGLRGLWLLPLLAMMH